MITLRLFHEDDLHRQLDTYILGDGDVSIGRDTAAIWVIDDPERRLSRIHCTVSMENGQVRVRDTSANGVFRGPNRERLEPGVDTQFASDEAIYLGRYVIVIDASRQKEIGTDNMAACRLDKAPMSDTFAKAGANTIPEDWQDAEPAVDKAREKSATGNDFLMLEAFCEGARLDTSYFASEDPLVLMRRIGEIYRQTVLGLGDMISERASLKTEYSMERTTIGPEANNPLKWAPTQRLATDLLCQRNGAFLSGGEAVKECFEDLKAHALCLVAGSRAAVSEVLDQLDPTTIEAEVKVKAPIFMERSEASWRRLKALHAEVSTNPFNNADSKISAAFRRGYESRARDLEPGS